VGGGCLGGRPVGAAPPHDNIFRLPWWLRRIARGGRVPAPGAPDNPIQIIDARDLARFLVDLAERRTAGAFNGTGPIGQTTWGELLQTDEAELVWIPDDKLQQAGVVEWTELPMWLPAARYPGTWSIDTTKAQAAGLTTRPVAETVRDVRTWLENGGEQQLGDYRAEHRPPLMSPERKAALLRPMW
jgi:nucleoside-diphosphate-sugar epimerase